MPPLAEELMVVLVTVPDEATGLSIAKDLLERRLAACVNRIAGVDSWYRWQGKIERAGEELLIIKAPRAQLDAVVARVRALHSYQVPEVLCLPVIGGNPGYLHWLAEETRA